MMDEVNNRSDAAKAKKQYKEDKLILDKMMNLIENQRMHDSFIEFNNLAVKNALATKIQKNLKSLLNYKKSMNVVNNYLSKEAIREFDQNIGSKRTKNRSDSIDTQSTETTSLAGLSNRGRAPDTKEKALAKMYKYKEIGDNLGVKLYERDSKNKYVIKDTKDIKYRKKLNQDVENAYANADRIAKKYGLK